mgnify:CR=1 FL=1
MRHQKQRKQQSVRRESLEQRLERHPKLKEQMEALVAIAENRDGNLEIADDAEGAILQQVRQMGGQTLREWAQQQADRKAAELLQLNPSACKHKKKPHVE